MQFTDEQYAAIHTHDRNLIVSAGAGSGKTRVLVERYLSLLENNADWPLNGLVAITFTKKAAQEMRDRVRTALEKRLSEAVEENAIQRWSDLLGQIDSARIDTIHGLCADLLRANAAEAAIDPKFEVLDDIEARILREDAVEEVLARLAFSGGAELALFFEYEGQHVRTALLDETLLAARPELPDDLLAAWTMAWQAGIAVQANVFRAEAAHIPRYDLPGDLIGEVWADCCDALDRLEGHLDENGMFDVLHRIAHVKLNGGSAKNWGSKEALEEAKAALKALREAAQKALKTIGNPPNDEDRRAADFLPLWASLLGQVRQVYEQMKAERGLLDFNDLEQITRDLLTGDVAVRLRYQGSEYRHLLVDEFQDTNAAQWAIVRALASLHTPGSMFVVGDEKQSIYAFRGADVSVFGDVRRQITNANGLELTLSASFRTHQPLVDCFNHIFGALLVRDSASPAAAYQVELGKPMTAHRQQMPDAAPLIEFVLVNQFEYDDEGAQINGPDGEPQKLNSEARRQWEAHEMAARIHHMVQSGRKVLDKGTGKVRPMRYDDVAILFRALSNVSLYEEVFKAAGLPFVTIAGRGYYSRQEVWDLLNLLQAVYNPADDLSLAVALRSPLFSLSDDALFALRLLTVSDDDSTPLPLWVALQNPGELFPADERERAAFAHECLTHLHAIAGRVTVDELLRDALERTGYLAVLTGLPDGARRRGNVEKLLEKAQTSGKVTLSAFSQYLRDLSVREAREGEAVVDVVGAVTIMTVHASKGLEYPVVVLADASWDGAVRDASPVMLDADFGLACRIYDSEEGKLKPTFSYQRAAYMAGLRDDAERLRLLYVAMTRAQDYLMICGQAQEKGKDDEWKITGWLSDVLSALSLQEHLMPCCDSVHTYAWGQVRLTSPARQQAVNALQAAEEANASLWEADSPTQAAVIPPLIPNVEIFREAQARHLAATHIADLGGSEFADDPEDRAFYRERFRRQVMHDAPSVVEWVSQDETQPLRVSARQVGEIVHEALRYWRLPADDPAQDGNLRQILYSYAWRQGITDDALCQEAMNRAYHLLRHFKQSDVCAWVNSAVKVYRELPFIYEQNGYIVHGVIDVLFQRPDGQWVIADYKTSTVKEADYNSIRRHAHRYHLQIGMYAEAVQAQLGVMPETVIHYIRYTQTIRVYDYEWQEALSRTLTERILEAIED
ncbi:MAG: hypothetical protein OHK0046_30720 [Anaerolineae bacterium]